ncbi:hypothetical protein EPN27_02935 [Patescibacteria group bacterium]|nr:MAG: hypothetical protein EPN27_02935 [Patescibacteria group bacterium]
MNNIYDTDLFKEKSGETYGQHCDRLEDAIMSIVRRADDSEKAVSALAFALMEAPADFDAGSRERPFQKARGFLSSQNREVKELFRAECKKLHRGRDDRINYLLGE